MRVSGIVHDGKESYNLDEAESFGLDSESYQTYSKDVDIDKKILENRDRILPLTFSQVKEFGIKSRQTWWNVRKKIEEGQLHRISNRMKVRLIEWIN